MGLAVRHASLPHLPAVVKIGGAPNTTPALPCLQCIANGQHGCLTKASCCEDTMLCQKVQEDAKGGTCEEVSAPEQPVPSPVGLEAGRSVRVAAGAADALSHGRPVLHVSWLACLVHGLSSAGPAVKPAG